MLYRLYWLLSWIPLWIGYGVVDLVLFPLAYHVVRYRRKVVRQNLRESFPDYDWRQLKLTERRFYRHFCDTIVETVHMMTMSEKEMTSRIQMSGAEHLNRFLDERGGAMMYLSHYGNWEWMSTYQHWLKPGYQGMSVYRKQHSESLTKTMLVAREHFGLRYAEKDQTLRVVIKNLREGKKCVWAMIADQHPSRNGEHYWTQFLNHDTAVLTGTETLARKFDWPVAMMAIHRTGRGHYQVDISPITEHPREEAEYWITEQYARLLEQNILEAPAYWLWTHKRWKHKRTAQDTPANPQAN